MSAKSLPVVTTFDGDALEPHGPQSWELDDRLHDECGVVAISGIENAAH